MIEAHLKEQTVAADDFAFGPEPLPSCVRLLPPRWSFWVPTDTGNKDLDWDRGRIFAMEALDYDKRHNMNVLTYILGDIASYGRLDNVTIGFLMKIADCARAGAMN